MESINIYSNLWSKLVVCLWCGGGKEKKVKVSSKNSWSVSNDIFIILLYEKFLVVKSLIIDQDIILNCWQILN